MQTLKEQFPKDFFVQISGDEFRIGRIVVNKNSKGFNAEIDIVQKDSMKIWQHVEILHNFDDENEALENAVQRLSNFLKRS